MARELGFLKVQDHRIEYELIRGPSSEAPWLVFLHEGLGSLAMWKDFPARCAAATGSNALVYSRYGYGQSDPLGGPRTVTFMHDEALKALPELLDQFGIDRPTLFGHSDGASIALVHAGANVRPIRSLILLAPHVFVEDFAIRAIEATRRNYLTTNLRDKLARYHADPDSAFWGWNDIWLHPDFRAWNIEEYLSRIECPVLAIQGEDDEYGTMEQIDRMARAVPRIEVLKLKNCGHSPHRDQPDAVIERVVQTRKDARTPSSVS
ncbi:MAG TPA: alpha/beta hydrolase [Bryobacteraceae bacterium]|nr:alpha/beta hydrolase [Bryobacteraceae bacterium]